MNPEAAFFSFCLVGLIIVGKAEDLMEMIDMKAEGITHPPLDQLQDMKYCMDSNPSWGKYSKCLGLYDSFSLLCCVFMVYKSASA
jgi:hypothetical protein